MRYLMRYLHGSTQFAPIRRHSSIGPKSDGPKSDPRSSPPWALPWSILLRYIGDLQHKACARAPQKRLLDGATAQRTARAGRLPWSTWSRPRRH